MYNLIVIDVETGGLNCTESPVTEIGLIVLDGETLKEKERYSSFVAPYGKAVYQEQALKYTGITMEQINSGKQAYNVVSEVHAIISKYINGKGKFKRKPILVGHNIDLFDRGFIEALFAEGKRDLYEVVERWVIDTMYLARYKWGFKEKGFALNECCERIGMPLVDAHRAMADIEANVNLLKFFLQNPIFGDVVVGTSQSVTKSRIRETFRF